MGYLDVERYKLNNLNEEWNAVVYLTTQKPEIEELDDQIFLDQDKNWSWN